MSGELTEHTAEGRRPAAQTVHRAGQGSDARLALADSYDLEVIVVCQEGYTSSLAAVSLRRLGLTNATDLDGGFAAWRAAGLPVS